MDLPGVNHKNKTAKLFYQQWVYLGILKNCNSGHASYSKTIANHFMEKEEELGGVGLNESPLKNKGTGNVDFSLTELQGWCHFL